MNTTLRVLVVGILGLSGWALAAVAQTAHDHPEYFATADVWKLILSGVAANFLIIVAAGWRFGVHVTNQRRDVAGAHEAVERVGRKLAEKSGEIRIADERREAQAQKLGEQIARLDERSGAMREDVRALGDLVRAQGAAAAHHRELLERQMAEHGQAFLTFQARAEERWSRAGGG